MWRKSVHGNDYEVRSAGRTLRLYTNGVFHSQYNPSRVFGGGLWDLLSLPALMRPSSDKPRILVLGVGGGAVIRALGELMNRPEIYGVDLDRTHLSIARQWFNTKLPKNQLIHADAKQWLTDYQGSPFDLIIDDVFSDDRGEPVRAIAIDVHWVSVLERHLSPSGMLVINHLSRSDAYRASRKLNSHFVESWGLQHPRYHNCVAVHLQWSFHRRHLLERLDGHPNLSSLDKRVAKKVELNKIRRR